MKFLYSFFFSISFLLLSVEGGDKSFKYYTDGVYDSYTGIKNSLKNGLEETPIYKYKDRWLVVKDITNESTVQVIFYQTVAYKNNFFEALISKNINLNKNFMVFGSYIRKADAKYASKKLLEQGVDVKVLYNNKSKAYIRNPIVVKKLVHEMRDLLRDTPVLVIREREIIERSCPDNKEFQQIQKEKCTPKIIYKKSSCHKIRWKAVYDEFVKLRVLFKKTGVIDVDNKMVSFKKLKGSQSIARVGEYIRGFKILDIYRNKRTLFDVLEFVGVDGIKYKIYIKICIEKTKNVKKDIVVKTTKVVPSSSPLPPQKKEIKKTTSERANKAVCDFRKVKSLKDDKFNNVRIKATNYMEKSSLKVTAKPISHNGTKYFQLRAAGYRVVHLREKYFNQYCRLIK